MITVLLALSLQAPCDTALAAKALVHTAAIRARHTAQTTVHNRGTKASADAIDSLLRCPTPVPVPPPAPPPTPPPTPTPPPAPAGVPSTAPTLPQATVDVALPAVTRTLTVSAGGNLQAALDSARRGDEVVLQAGATFSGNFTLGSKAGSSAQGWVTVRTSAISNLPPLGTRIDPAAHAAFMPKIVTPNVLPAIATRYNTPGISGWRLIGLEIMVAPGAATAPAIQQGVVLFGSGDQTENTVAKLPRDLILDRSIVRGQANANVKKCVAANAIAVAVINSQLLECHGNGFDSQAIIAFNSPGPIRIENNRLEAAGEVVMFGGAVAPIQGLVNSDITIRRNILTRPMAWRGQWTVKNLFELKNAQRVLFTENILENHWAGGQAGAAVVLGTADNPCSWCIVSDVTFEWNHIHNVAGAFNLFPRYGNAQPMRRVKIANTLTTNAGAAGLTIGGTLYVYQLQDNVDDLWLEQNTAFSATQQYVALSGSKARFTFRNNLGGASPYAWWSSQGMGDAANAAGLTSPYLVSGNCFLAPTAPIPSGSTRITSVGAAVTSCSQAGVDQAALTARLAGVR